MKETRSLSAEESSMMQWKLYSWSTMPRSTWLDCPMSFQHKYTKQLMDVMVKQDDATKFLAKFSLNEAIPMMSSAWNSIEPETMKRSWNKLLPWVEGYQSKSKIHGGNLQLLAEKVAEMRQQFSQSDQTDDEPLDPWQPQTWPSSSRSSSRDSSQKLTKTLSKALHTIDAISDNVSSTEIKQMCTSAQFR